MKQTIKQTIKRGVTLLGAIFAVAIIGLSLTLAPAVQADSFKGTNFINTGVQYAASNPTNGTGIATGTGIDVQNYNNLGFYFQGDVSNSASAIVVFKLPRAHKTPAGVTNWETTPQYSITVTIPAMTNTFSWCTNLPTDYAGPALFAGCSSITNNLAAGNSITNADYGVVKKIVPVRFP